MEISLLAILLSIAALGLNVMLIAFWRENKKEISSVNRHLENEIKWQEKDNEQRYVKNVHYKNAIRDFKINILRIDKDIWDLKEKSHNKENENDDKDIKTAKYRVTFEVKRMYNSTIPIMYHPQYEIECRAKDMDSVVNKAQEAFDSHPDNVELEREIVKIEVLGR
ncbi:hypothetical protein [Mammaliicoccus lentus]|uniref:Uncharacterized protein n=1 Tax=Mammaliicoccus lentus TaxID=42858 RepID=A0ABS6GV64_MAMLE|nr:hypothetical protein [Mammaliicoccus lentus]MBU6112522.1 hypothetical protein [Mammaliicoccus lentus]